MTSHFPSPSAQMPSIHPLRLYLPSSRARPQRACFDGAWWPYTDDLAGQAVELARVVGDNWKGRVERITYDPTIWTVVPRKIFRDGPALRMGWFRSKEPYEITLVMIDGRRVELLVVPVTTSAKSADWMMKRAVENGSTTHATELVRLADGVYAGRSRWDC